MYRAFSSARFGAVLIVAGAALFVLGALPWIALLMGTEGAATPVLLILAALAGFGGAFVVLVGAGVLRSGHAAQRATDERRLDAAVLAATAQGDPDCGAGCTTCTASCALQNLRS